MTPSETQTIYEAYQSFQPEPETKTKHELVALPETSAASSSTPPLTSNPNAETSTRPLIPWSTSRRVDPDKAQRVFNEIAERRIDSGEISREELEVLLETGDRGIQHGKIAGYASAAISTFYLSRKWRRIGTIPSILGIMGGGALGAVVVGVGSSVWSYKRHYGMLQTWDEDTIDRKWRILEEINAEAGERAKPSWQQRQRRPGAGGGSIV
ncbi:hypothetical protein IAT40_006044 [Kwoniella sp. CBS 6097]